MQSGRTQGASLLEREERVSAGNLVDPPQERPGHGVPEIRLDQVVKRRRVERPQRDSRQVLGRQHPLELRGGRAALVQPAGEQEADRLRAEPTGGKADDLQGRRVEPLEIVDRDEHLPVVRERAKRAEERRGYPARVRLLTGRGDEEGNLECAPLRARQLRKHILHHRLQQIVQPGKRELRLDLDRAGGQNQRGAATRGTYPLEPEGRLAHSRRALDLQCMRAVCAALQEPIELRELRFPADELLVHHPIRPLWLSPPTLSRRLPIRKPRGRAGTARHLVTTHRRPKYRASAFQRASSAFSASAADNRTL